jgi:hypothetical protein
MKAPALAAVMERRILVNYRVDPDLLGSYLPAPFRPGRPGHRRLHPQARHLVPAGRARRRPPVPWLSAPGPVPGT